MFHGLGQGIYCTNVLKSVAVRHYLNDAKEADILDYCGLPLNWGLNLGWGRTGLVVRASDFGIGRPGFDPRPGRCVVSLSKRHLLPKSTGNTQE